MKIGCLMHNFPDTPLREVCRAIKGLGAEAIEACHMMGQYPYVNLDQDPVAQREVIDSYGLEVSGLSAHCEMIEAPKSVSYLKKAIRWAASAGIPCVITGEGPKPDAMSDEQAFKIAKDRMLDVIEEAERFEVALAVEPHGIFSRTLPGLKRLMSISQSEYYIINYDVGNIVHSPEEDSAEILREVVDRVGYVHIKDKKFGESPRGRRCLIGTGDVNIAGCLEVLKEAGYDGVLSVEAYRSTSPVEHSKAGIDYLRSLLAPG